MTTIFIGAVMVVYGLVILPLRTHRSNRGARAAADAGPTPADQVAWRAREAPGAAVSVEGVAGEGPGGPLTAPLSGRECVWHRVVEIERRTHRRTGRRRPSGPRTEVREHVIRDEASAAPFALSDDRGACLVLPEGADVRDLDPVVDRHDEATSRPEDLRRVGVGRLSVEVDTGNLRGTVTREYVIEAGRRLSAAGAAVAGEHGGAVGRPDEGAFIISTRPMTEVAGAARRGTVRSLAVGAGVAVLGAVLILTGVSH